MPVSLTSLGNLWGETESDSSSFPQGLTPDLSPCQAQSGLFCSLKWWIRTWVMERSIFSLFLLHLLLLFFPVCKNFNPIGFLGSGWVGLCFITAHSKISVAWLNKSLFLTHAVSPWLWAALQASCSPYNSFDLVAPSSQHKARQELVDSTRPLSSASAQKCFLSLPLRALW
jgi:hypothetical protein